jgi:uncharacterized protein HemX
LTALLIIVAVLAQAIAFFVAFKIRMKNLTQRHRTFGSQDAETQEVQGD